MISHPNKVESFWFDPNACSQYSIGRVSRQGDQVQLHSHTATQLRGFHNWTPIALHGLFCGKLAMSQRGVAMHMEAGNDGFP